LITKVVPVKLRWEAQIDPDFQCVDRGITPAQVELEGARTLLQPVDQVQTKKLSLQIDEKRQWRGSVGLDISPEIEVRPATVEISLRFAPKTTNLWVRSRVTARPSPENGVSIEPESVRLHLELPLPLLEKEEWRKEIKVFVSIEDLEPGVYQRGYHVDLPKDTRILELKPSQLRVVLDTPADNEGKEAGPES
jgi:hypothetical protein